MLRDTKYLGFLPRWRGFTYVNLAINLLMLAWLIAAIASAGAHTKCGALQAMSCPNGSNAGPGVTALPIVTLWVLGGVILGALWLNTGRDTSRLATHPAKADVRCPDAGVSAAPARAGFEGYSAYFDGPLRSLRESQPDLADRDSRTA